MNLKIASCLLLIFILFSYPVISQSSIDTFNITGKVLDIQTEQSVPFVNIYFMTSSLGTITDTSGAFSIQVNKHNTSDTLIFSSLGYKTKKIPIQNMRNQHTHTILIEEDVLGLDEVIVSKLSAVGIIKKAMKERKNTYGILPHKLSGTYRITDQEDGAYVRLLESAIDIYDPNYLKKESRVVDYLALRQSKDFRTFKWNRTKHNARNLDELLKPDLIKRPTRATHPNGFQKGFFYTLEKNVLLNGEQVYVISAKKNTEYQWPNYDAVFYVRVKDYAILRVDREYTIHRPNWAKTPKGKTKITKDRLILKYKEKDGRLYLNYFLWNLKGEVRDTKSNKKIVSFERNEELNIHKVSLQTIPTKPNTWDNDIYKIDMPYDNVFWENYPVSNTQLFKNVQKELEERESLQDQFVSSRDAYTIYNPLKTYKVKELKEDFNILRKSLEEGHPSLYRYTSKEELSNDFNTAYQKITTPLTEVEFYKLITPIISKIQCGHTQSSLSEQYHEFYKNRKVYFPLQTRFNNGLLINSKDFSVDQDTILSGSILLAINNKPFTKIYDELVKNIPSDGYIQTSKNLLIGDHFSELYHIYFNQEEDFLLKFKSPNGDHIEKRYDGISFTDLLLQKEKTKQDNQYRSINPETALLKIAQFTDTSKIDFKNWIKKTFSDIHKNKIKYLVIDLRDNSGGRDDYAIYLYSFLTSTAFNYHQSLEAATNNYSFLSYTNQDESFNTRMQKIVQKDPKKRFVLTDSHPTLGTHQPSSPSYTGKVFFLINGNTFSAAADLAAIAQHNKKGTFIGQETGGTTVGNTSNGELLVTLPYSGIRMYLPLFKVTNAVIEKNRGRGVIPDIKTTYTLTDIRTTTDIDMQTVLRLLPEK